MLIKKPDNIRPSEITDEGNYRNRRRFLKRAATIGLALPGIDIAEKTTSGFSFSELLHSKPAQPLGDHLTSYKDIITYNNFYEFGTGKSDPAKNAGSLKIRPWTIFVEGLVRHPKRYDIEALFKSHPAQERIYRHRCVEGWSMVIPWMGFPLASLLKEAEPLGNARFVEFTTLYDPKQMPGQRIPVLKWPYVEGLRLDEAFHPLTLLASGLYGKPMPNQNGAPLRLVMPWKYGFKSFKSIVKIRLTDRMPQTTWNLAAADEYGFYSNVNPNVDPPRWSQATERRIGDWGRRPTLMFNGYVKEVAHLYRGMDLKRNF